MKFVYTCLLLMSASVLSAQDVSTTYSKDPYGDKPESNEKRADYRREVRMIGENQMSIEIYRMSDDVMVRRMEYTGDIPTGPWLVSDMKGEKIAELNYDDYICRHALNLDSLRDANKNMPKSDSVQKMQEKGDSTFTIVEKMPEYPGGIPDMYNFLGKNLKYPEFCKENGIQGTVYLSFVIDRDGSIIDQCILRSVHPLLDMEAFRVLQLMPEWTPGEQRGKKVKVSYLLPLKFSLR